MLGCGERKTTIYTVNIPLSMISKVAAGIYCESDGIMGHHLQCNCLCMTNRKARTVRKRNKEMVSQASMGTMGAGEFAELQLSTSGESDNAICPKCGV